MYHLPCICWNERLSLGADDFTACFVAKDEELGSWTTEGAEEITSHNSMHSQKPQGNICLYFYLYFYVEVI